MQSSMTCQRQHQGPPPILGRFWLRLPAIALLSLLPSCGRESTPVTGLTTTNQTQHATEAVKPEFAKLIGKWQRPDGGYVLEIKSIDAAGKLDAAYFNPNPINVSQARAIREGQTTKIFVELRDVNYPGSTYSLSYDPSNDQLFGTYFQAAIKQTFDVAFGRMR